MPGIVVKPNESFEEAYRKFKKQVDRNLIVTEKRARRYFLRLELKRERNKRLQLERKCLKNFICLEDTNRGYKLSLIKGVFTPFIFFTTP